MKKANLSDGQTLEALNRFEVGLPVSEICGDLRISTATFSKRRTQYVGMGSVLP
jgi:putative transposase